MEACRAEQADKTHWRAHMRVILIIAALTSEVTCATISIRLHGRLVYLEAVAVSAAAELAGALEVSIATTPNC